MQPLALCLWIFVGACAATWLLSVVTREYSWTDRIWSLIPIAYVAVFAVAADPTDARLVLMLVLVALWGARLTFNFARKGGYAPGGEDYRWPVLRARMRPWQFQLFNLFFISIYQNVILLAICLPAYTAYENRTPLGALDFLAAVVFLAFLAGETLADQQQWNFHQRKAATIAAGGTPSPRFLTSGLFRYSRHPNFFFEQAQWIVFYAFAAIAAGSVLQWTVVGAVLLVLLFVGSTRFTESITRSKYPEYAEYQRTTSALIPWFPTRRLSPPQPAHHREDRA
jgi:steroid 5-alpha reductase family enzyme